MSVRRMLPFSPILADQSRVFADTVMHADYLPHAMLMLAGDEAAQPRCQDAALAASGRRHRRAYAPDCRACQQRRLHSRVSRLEGRDVYNAPLRRC